MLETNGDSSTIFKNPGSMGGYGGTKDWKFAGTGAARCYEIGIQNHWKFMGIFALELKISWDFLFWKRSGTSDIFASDSRPLENHWRVFGRSCFFTIFYCAAHRLSYTKYFQ